MNLRLSVRPRTPLGWVMRGALVLGLCVALTAGKGGCKVDSPEGGGTQLGVQHTQHGYFAKKFGSQRIWIGVNPPPGWTLGGYTNSGKPIFVPPVIGG